MLGWVLNRASGAGDPNNSQVELPDTPAPVFAARALKSALFGTPVPPRQSKSDFVDEIADCTPVKAPQGILLTPGTGTARRKRVSFGRQLYGDAAYTLPVRRVHTSKPPSASSPTRRTAFLQARPAIGQATDEFDYDGCDDTADDEEGPEDCGHDATVDLNDPHSRSGKYWKSYFEQYHQDAKTEMEKLLRYKELAKSYAQQKDVEATRLAEKLREKQETLMAVESKLATSRQPPRADDKAELVKALATQTAEAVDSRNRVREVEDELAALMRTRREQGNTDTNAATNLGFTVTARRKQTEDMTTSARTQQTLLDTQRELRKARLQAQEVGDLRVQVRQLRSELATAQRKVERLEDAKAEDRRQRLETEADLRAEVQKQKQQAVEAETRLREAEDGCRRRDEQLNMQQVELERLHEQSYAHEEESQALLKQATNKITQLKSELASAPTSGDVLSDTLRRVREAEEGCRSRDEKQDDLRALLDQQHEQSCAYEDHSHEQLSQATDNITKLKLELAAAQTNGGASSTLLRRLREAEEGCRSRDDKLDDLRALLDQLRSDTREREHGGRDTINRASAKIDRLRSEVRTLKTVADRRGSPSTHHPPLDPPFAGEVSVLTDTYDANVAVPRRPFGSSGGLGIQSAKLPAKSTLPPDRLAAAIARIEQRMQEKRLLAAGKENQTP